MTDAATTEQAPTGPYMMRGTGGVMDYFVFARKGQNIMGIKPYTVADAKRMGAPGCTYIEVRLRAATAPAETLPPEPGNVASMPMRATKVWPLEWDKEHPNQWASDTMYGSKSVHLIVRGNPEESRETIKHQLDSGNIAQQFTDYFMGLISPDERFVEPEALKAWLQAYYTAVFAKIFDSIDKMAAAKQKAAEISEAMVDSIGIVTATSSLLKKQHEAYKAAHPEEAANEAEDDDDDDDAGVGDGDPTDGPEHTD